MSLTVAPQTYSLTVVPGGVVLAAAGVGPNAAQTNGDNTFSGVNSFTGLVSFGGAVTFGGNVTITGGSLAAGAVTADTVSATSFTGNGANLTALSPGNMVVGVFPASEVFTGPLIVRHSGGVAGTDEYVIDHDGTAVKLRNADTGGFLFRNAADNLTTLSIDNTGRAQTGNLYLDPWGGSNGGWINFGTGGPGGIGTGGVGQDLWIGRSASTNQFFIGSAAGDICFRSTSNKLLFGHGTGGNSAVMVLQDGSPYLDVIARQAANVPVRLRGQSSQSGNLTEWTDPAGTTVYATVSENGYFTVRKNAIPADAELAAGEMALWFDSTNGAAKLMVKAKQADGTVRTGSLALA